jgi:hypothetical protein
MGLGRGLLGGTPGPRGAFGCRTERQRRRLTQGAVDAGARGLQETGSIR